MSGHEAGQAIALLSNNVLVGQTVIGQIIPGAVSNLTVGVAISAQTVAIRAATMKIWVFNMFSFFKKKISEKKEGKENRNSPAFLCFIRYIF